MTGLPGSPNAGRSLVLIRHATPEIDYSRPAATWELSAQGVNESRALGRRLADAGIDRLYASEEPKAAGTAREIAGTLGITWRTHPGLHEHARGALPRYGPEKWHDLIRRCMEHPNQLVLGAETAAQALARFSAAVDEVLRDSTATTLGITSHGTVMSLYTAALTGTPAYVIWSKLKMPDYVTLVVP